jgi:glycerol-3-phosphate dehydrogenase (NAD(P)+)
MKVVVVGAGAWGTAFAHLLARHDHEVVLAARDEGLARSIEETGENHRYHPGIPLNGVTASTIADAPVAESDLVAIAVPSRVFGDVVRALPGNAPLLSLSKGLDPATGSRLSALVDDRPVAVLSGPNFAAEVVAEKPFASVVASVDRDLGERLQRELISGTFRVYLNTDVMGVELCGAAKNVMALAAGVVDGLELGDNAKAAMLTRGLAEMSRLGTAAGARLETFSGLAGMGDLVVTGWSHLSRNRREGELIARGEDPLSAASTIGSTVESISTAPALARLASRLGVDLPITDAVSRVLHGEDPGDLIVDLMARPPSEE